MNVLGIDPSMTATGVALLDGTLTTIKYKAAPGCKRLEGDDRLYSINSHIGHYATEAELAIVEDLPTHAHGAGITGMVQGVVRLALIRAAVHYITVPPATLKKFATGKGNATKSDMRMAWFQRTGEDVRDDNQVDAAWLRQIGLHLTGGDAISLPKSHTDVLAKLDYEAAKE